MCGFLGSWSFLCSCWGFLKRQECNNADGGKEHEVIKKKKKGIQTRGPWRRQNQRGSGCSQLRLRQRERGERATGPCLFNHLQLHFMQTDYCVSNGNQTLSTVKWLKINTRSEETLLLIVQSSVLRCPWIMEISVITTSGGWGVGLHVTSLGRHSGNVDSAHPSADLGCGSLAG